MSETNTDAAFVPLLSDQLDAMDVGEKRRLLRRYFPGIPGMGVFANNATKTVLDEVLGGSVPPQDAVRSYLDGLVPEGARVTTAGANAPDAPHEGVAGEDPPADGQPKARRRKRLPGDQADPNSLDGVLSALETLGNPAAAEIRKLQGMESELTRLQKKMIEDELARQQRLLQSLVCVKPAGVGEVEVMGQRFPLLSDGSHPLVPKQNPNYMLKAWRAAKTCGAMVFKQDAVDLLKLTMANERVFLAGPPSSGKTSIVTMLAAIVGAPLVRINLNRDMTLLDFVGGYEARDGSTIWVDGPLTSACRHGYWVLLDELDHAPAPVTSCLHAPLEPGNRGSLVLTTHGGEVVPIHPSARFFGTGNTNFHGDALGLHPNANVQDFALKNRFTAVLAVGWMEPEQEVALLMESFGTDGRIADLMVKVATDTRLAATTGTLMYPITVRQTMSWARALLLLGNLGNAFAVSVLNTLPDSDVAPVAEIAQRHLGEELKGA
jgi:MoxR-like ATPase